MYFKAHKGSKLRDMRRVLQGYAWEVTGNIVFTSDLEISKCRLLSVCFTPKSCSSQKVSSSCVLAPRLVQASCVEYTSVLGPNPYPNPDSRVSGDNMYYQFVHRRFRCVRENVLAALFSSMTRINYDVYYEQDIKLHSKKFICSLWP